MGGTAPLCSLLRRFLCYRGVQILCIAVGSWIRSMFLCRSAATNPTLIRDLRDASAIPAMKNPAFPMAILRSTRLYDRRAIPTAMMRSTIAGLSANKLTMRSRAPAGEQAMYRTASAGQSTKCGNSRQITPSAAGGADSKTRQRMVACCMMRADLSASCTPGSSHASALSTSSRAHTGSVSQSADGAGAISANDGQSGAGFASSQTVSLLHSDEPDVDSLTLPRIRVVSDQESAIIERRFSRGPLSARSVYPCKRQYSSSARLRAR